MANALIKVAAIVAVLAVLWYLPLWIGLLALVFVLPTIGRLKIANGRLAIGGGFGHVHTFEHVQGMSVPQCSTCGAFDD